MEMRNGEMLRRHVLVMTRQKMRITLRWGPAQLISPFLILIPHFFFLITHLECLIPHLAT